MAVNDFLVEADGLLELAERDEATAVSPSSPVVNETKRKRPFLIPTIFIAGLVLGWLVLGWWLWPVEWINAEPQNLSPEFQKVYIGLVASDYSLTRDIGRVQQILEKWDKDVLADLLSDMIISAKSVEERERLILLAEAMTLPETEISLTDVFFGQTLVLVGVGVSVLFLGAALLITAVPAMKKQSQRRARKRSQEMDQQAILDEIREEMGDLLEDEAIFVDAAGEAVEIEAVEKEKSELEKMVDAAEEEVTEEEEKAAAEAKAAEENASLQAPSDDEDDPYLILDDDEEDEEEDGGGDPIFDLFQEDDDNSQEIDNLANPLPPVHMEDVLALSQQIMTQFRENVRRPVKE